jgi:hypothetical protein
MHKVKNVFIYSFKDLKLIVFQVTRITKLGCNEGDRWTKANLYAPPPPTHTHFWWWWHIKQKLTSLFQ